MSNDALNNLKIATEARIAERLAHYEEILSNGTQVSGETLLEIIQFLAVIMPKGAPAKEPLEAGHWKRTSKMHKADANPNTVVTFHDNP